MGHKAAAVFEHSRSSCQWRQSRTSRYVRSASSKGRQRRAVELGANRCIKLVGLQLLLLLLFLFYPTCYDFSKPRVPHMQAASCKGEALKDARVEDVLLIDS